MKLGDGTVTQLPKDHRVNLQETRNQTLSVFTESKSTSKKKEKGKKCIYIYIVACIVERKAIFLRRVFHYFFNPQRRSCH